MVGTGWYYGATCASEVGGAGGDARGIHATFSGLASTSDAVGSPEPFVHDILEILKRISRRPIEPTLESALLADLGFDSLQVLELVGELEDHFKIAVPLNDLTRIRTVAQVVAEVRGLVSALERPA